MTRKRIATALLAMALATIFLLFTSIYETCALSHNKKNNNTQLVRDIQLLLSLDGFSGHLDGRCGDKTKGAIEKAIEKYVGKPAEKPSETTCSAQVMQTISAKMAGKLSGEPPEDIKSLFTKLYAKTADMDKKIDAMAIDISGIKSAFKALSDSISTKQSGTTSSHGTAYIVTTIFMTATVAVCGFIYRLWVLEGGGTYLFGAPFGETGKLKFIEEIEMRFKNDDPKAKAAEAAVAYLGTITDRIITKAVGLLQFNAVVVAITYLVSYSYAGTLKFPQMEYLLLGASIIFSILSTSCVILMLFTHWRKCYQSPWKDVVESARLCMMRSIGITFGLILGWIAVLCNIAVFVYTNIDK